MKTNHLLCVLLLLALIGVSQTPAHATGFHDEMEAGTDIMMKELRWPIFARGTYFAIWYNKFHPNGYTNFYGGVATGGSEKPPGMFMTYWGDLTNVHEGPYFQPHGYGAEGAKGGANGKAGFMKEGKWYRFVMRIYPSPNQEEQASYIGWWVKDVEENRWHTHSVVKIPVRETGFTRNGGFVEELADKKYPRQMDRRLGYYRLNGKWKASHLSTNHHGRFKLAENDSIVQFRTPLENDPPALENEVTLRTKQPAQPVLDKPAIQRATAKAFGNQIVVQWSAPDAASPQLRYTIEAFSEPQAQGKLLSRHSATGPQIHAKRLDCPAPAKSVRLTVMGIFDQTTSVVTPVVQMPTPTKAQSVTKLFPGLKYQYFEAPEETEWTKLPDFRLIQPDRLGYVKFLDDSIRLEREQQYGLNFKGLIKVPTTGIYVFELGTSDGGRMHIDGNVLADNDGIHGTTVGHYPMNLDAGYHSFELDYFHAHKRPVAGGGRIVLRWEGPGLERRDVSKADLFCIPEGTIPSLTLSVPTKKVNGVLTNNLVDVVADIKTGGHPINKIQFFYGSHLLGSKQVTGDGKVVLSTLLPAGKNQITARLWYAGSQSVSGDFLSIETKNQTAGPWKFADFGETKFPLGLRYENGKAHFAGEGARFGYQIVKGDFTLTARIANAELATEENGIAQHNWVGLMVKHKDPEISKGPYDMAGDYGVFLTTGRGIRGTADFPDLGGGHMSNNPLAAPENRWLRIVRRGKQYQSFVSIDGKQWQKVAERVSERFRGEEAYVGMSFRAVPGKNRTFFNAVIDDITLRPGAPPRTQVSKHDSANVALDKRITALVRSRDGKMILARSTAGLLKTTDNGETWTQLDGNLKSPTALAVRSIAIHPKNHAIILRAGGRVVDGKLVSGLWKTVDGGKSWVLKSSDIDFDGLGPATLFGEVIQYNPNNPDHIIAAGETKGLFVSWDGGETWKSEALQGERITCLDFSDQLQYGREPLFIVGTFADQQFEALGMAKPARPTNTPGCIYWGTFRGKQIRTDKSFEIPEAGVTNVLFDAHKNFAHATTTRGLYFTWMHGIAFSQRRYKLVSDTLMIALGSRGFSDWSRYTVTAPFAESGETTAFYSQERGFRWKEITRRSTIEGAAGISLTDGITSVLLDPKDTKVILLCNRHGVFKSSDEGKTYRLVR